MGEAAGLHVEDNQHLFRMHRGLEMLIIPPLNQKMPF
jgi:hypothetical protein